MGDGNIETPNNISLLPVSAQSADCKFKEICLRLKNTPKGGKLQGIIEPIWNKTMESEQRLIWLEDMIKRKLVVREILNFGNSVKDKLRTESSREEEIGREVLMELMKVKLVDEKRYYREYSRLRHKLRDWLRQNVGRKKYNSLMENIKKRIEKNRENMKMKLRMKTKFLKGAREKELIERLQIVPPSLGEFRDCIVFKKDIMEKIEPSPGLKNFLIFLCRVSSKTFK